MAMGKSRKMSAVKKNRMSFVSFVKGDTFDDDGASSNSWVRLIHSASLLGYSLMLSAALLAFIVILSSLEWVKSNGEGGLSLNNYAVFYGMGVPIMLSYVLAHGGVVTLSKSHFGTRKYGAVAAVAGALTFPVFAGTWIGMLSAGVDMKYNVADFIFFYLFVLVFFIVESKLRSRWIKRDSKRNPNSRKSTRALEAITEEKDRRSTAGVENLAKAVNSLNASETAKKKKKKKKASITQVLLGSLSIAVNFTLTGLYPMMLMPYFFSSDVLPRLMICLVLHPLLLELAETMLRSKFSDNIMRKCTAGKMPLHLAEQQLIEQSAQNYGTKQMMALFRRFMLLNMGSEEATIIAVVVACVEEAVSRGFIAQIDGFVRRLQGLPKLEGDALKLQNVVWMCDANQSAIAEFVAIIASSIAQVMLEPHKLVLAIGYSLTETLDAAAVFAMLIVELLLEAMVDSMCMFAEEQQGIPVSSYFHRNSLALFFVHLGFAILNICIVIFAFVRHPMFFTCPSTSACDCIEQAIFRGWMDGACDMNSTHAASSYNATGNEVFEDVDFKEILVALITGAFVLALVGLSAIFARYRKRKNTILALQSDLHQQGKANLELLANLEAKKLRARLDARPPGAFTVEEFEEELKDAMSPDELIDKVVAICEDWVFVSPISDQKWDYFLHYVVYLPFWEDKARFGELQTIASAANAVISEHVRRLIGEMEVGEEHGPWLLNELDHINSKSKIADLVQWVSPVLLAPAKILSTPAAKTEFETAVLPVAIRALANMLLAPFQKRLLSIHSRVRDEDEYEEERQLDRTQRGSLWRSFSVLRVPEAADSSTKPILLRCSEGKSVKGAKRMGEKVVEASNKGVPFPAINNLGDALRASYCAETSQGVREIWNAVSENFEVLRLKNKFRDAASELRSGGDLKTISPNLHINMLFKYNSNGDELNIVVELQIYINAILSLKVEAHKIYDVTRAKSITALRH